MVLRKAVSADADINASVLSDKIMQLKKDTEIKGIEGALMKVVKCQKNMFIKQMLFIELFLTLCILIIPNQLFAVSDTFPPYENAPTVASFLTSPNNVYYCSPTGNNTTGDGTIANPWVDLIGAESRVRAGDLIYFRGGDYPAYPYENFSRSRNILTIDGSPTRPIVITNYPGEIVRYNSVDTIWSLTLDGDHQKLIGTKVGSEYGIQITGGITVRGDNCQVSSVEFVGGTSNGGDLNPAMLSVPTMGWTDNLKITHCYFHDSKHQSSANRMAGIRFFTNSNSIVEYNIFKNNHELSDCSCVYYKDRTSNSSVRYNTFINSAKGVQYFTQGDTHNGLNVHDNLFCNVTYSICFRNETAPNVSVHNNVVLSIPAGGAFFYYLNADPVVSSSRGEYYNNVIGGTGFAAGWHTNSSNPNNLPTLFDYNLWYSSNDRNGSGLWNLPSGYHSHAITANNSINYNPSSMTCTVEDDYVGRNAGRNGTTIGGFTFGGTSQENPYDIDGDGDANIDEDQDASITENQPDGLITTPRYCLDPLTEESRLYDSGYCYNGYWHSRPWSEFVIWEDNFDDGVPLENKYFEYHDDDGDCVPVSYESFSPPYSLRGRFQQGEVEAGGIKKTFGRTPSSYLGRHAARPTEDFREIYWRFYLKMQDGWIGAPAKVCRVTSMANASWAQGMIAHLWSGSDVRLLMDPASGIDEQGDLITIKYNDFENLIWLGSRPGTFPLFSTESAGKWYCIEGHVKLDDAGESNGIFEFWIDGELQARRDDIAWVKSWDDYGINGLFFANYWNAGSAQDQERYFDDIVIATERIGQVNVTPQSSLDLNGDGNVNVQDVTLCVNIILGTTSGDGDVNGDGATDIQDIMAIVNGILGN